MDKKIWIRTGSYMDHIWIIFGYIYIVLWIIYSWQLDPVDDIVKAVQYTFLHKKYLIDLTLLR